MLGGPRSGGVNSLEETFHSMPLGDLVARMRSDLDVGLSSREAESRLEEHGLNRLSPPAVTPEWIKFARHFLSFFSLLLEAGALLCFTAFALDRDAKENLYLGIVLATVVFSTCLFTYFQEAKSADLLRQFSMMLPTQSLVMRDGVRTVVDATTLVPGDVLVVRRGDKVPADARVVRSRGLKVDNSSLTGESDPQTRTDAPTHEIVLETANVVFSGTMATDGEGLALIVATGDESVIGRIASLMTSTSVAETPIHIEIAHFIRIIAAIAITLGLIFGVVSVAMSRGLLNSLVFMIGIIVANVPEGLLATVTVSLTLTAKRMATKMVLVKSLESVETLGSTTLIASDKTGTLTQNRMTVVNVWVDGELRRCAAHRHDSHEFDAASPGFRALRDCATICCKAVFASGPTSALGDIGPDNMALPATDRETIGDASESALIKFCDPLIRAADGGGIDGLRRRSPVVFEIPFNASNKWHLVIARPAADPSADVLYIKGAAERVFARCSTVLLNGEQVTIDDAFRDRFHNACDTIARKGQRVLGFARLTIPRGKKTGLQGEVGNGEEDNNNVNGDNDGKGEEKGNKKSRAERLSGFGAANNLGEADEGSRTGSSYDDDDDDDDDDGDVGEEYTNSNVPDGGYCFVGLVSLLDPPREDVPRAVSLCQSAGVKVMMVTGDHPVTALAIAREVGIVRGKTVEDLALERDVDVEAIDPDEADAVVVTGSALRDLAEAEWDNILSKDQIVFARVSPQQKLIIVEHCQLRKEIVAVTGDGVNDSPALKKADIGIAMGITGSDVAKEAADMILLDDNFASIVAGIEEGRLIFENLKKSIAYTLSSNIPEIAPFILHVMFDIPLPLSTALILAIDLLADMGPAIALAYEPAESDIMHRPPRNAQTDRLVTRKLISFSYLQVGMCQAFGALFVYFVVLCDYGFKPASLFGRGREWEDAIAEGENLIDPEAMALCSFKPSIVCGNLEEALLHAQTASFISIILMQIGDLLVCKTRRGSIFTHGLAGNVAVLWGILSELMIGVLIVYVPFMNTALQTRPIRFEHWIPGIPFALIIVAYEELRKWCVRSHLKDRANLARYAAVGDPDEDDADVFGGVPPSIFKPRDFKRWVATYTPW